MTAKQPDYANTLTFLLRAGGHPHMDFSGWMRLAFPPEMRINDLDHPIAKMIRGE